LSRANKFIALGNERLRTFRGGRLTNGFLESNGFKIVPKGAATAALPQGERRFWVVSPNVAFNPSTIDLWKQAIRDNEAAFMGWGPKDDKHPLGPKFAETIAPDDVILIARRSEGNPDVVGFGVVTGKYKTRLKEFTIPALDRKTWHGSIRKLSPFASVTALPSGLPIWRTVNHAAALCQLHPDRILEHRKVCDWMIQKLGLSNGKNVHRGAALKPKPATQIVRRKPHRDPAQFDFSQRSAEAVRVARKLEAALVRDYKKCLGDRGHVVEQLLYGRLVCDAHEEDRNNLIEAKSSNGRSYIRMAVGQLLDYAFLGKEKFGTPHMAILLPRKPEPEILKWLDGLKISVIWKQREAFVDNASGQFT
jgi:hypothetical protein